MLKRSEKEYYSITQNICGLEFIEVEYQGYELVLNAQVFLKYELEIEHNDIRENRFLSASVDMGNTLLTSIKDLQPEEADSMEYEIRSWFETGIWPEDFQKLVESKIPRFDEYFEIVIKK